MANWWEDSPTLDQAVKAPQALPPSGGNFWESSPTIQQAVEGFANPLKVEEVGEKGAGIGTAAIASLATDPRAQIRYYAEKRGIPETRYGVKDGQVYYLGDDGKAYAEIPQTWDPTSIARRVATGVGPSFPAVPGTVAGIISAPMMAGGPAGIAGSMAISGGATAAGEAAREGLANKLMGQEVSPARIAVEGAQGALGQGLGAGLTAFGNREVARDIAKLDTVKSAALQAKAQNQGVPLTPAEVTGLPSLKAQQKYVGNTVGGQDTMGEFYQGRSQKVSDAITRYLDNLSTVDSAEVSGRMGKEAAEKTIKTAVRQRSAQAGPLYDAAYKVKLPDDVLNTVKSDPLVEEALGYVRSNKAYAREIKDLPDNSLQVLDLAKRRLDDMYSTAKQSGSGNEARLIDGARNDLLTALDDATTVNGTSLYKVARDAFSGKSPEIDRLKSGVTGALSEINPEKAAQAAQKLFGPNSGPLAIAQAKQDLSASPEAWQALKRTWLQDMFESAKKENITSIQGNGPNIAGRFAVDIENNASRLRAALEPTEFNTLQDLKDVLKAASSVKPIGSDTEYNRLITESMKDQARPFWAKVAGNINPVAALRNFDDWLTTRSMESISGRLADVITAPDATKNLKQLKMLTPSSVNFRIIAGHLLGSTPSAAVSAALPSDDIEPTDIPIPAR